MQDKRDGCVDAPFVPTCISCHGTKFVLARNSYMFSLSGVDSRADLFFVVNEVVMDYETKIAELAETFPTLQGAPLRSWDARAFEKWASERQGTGLRHAAQFVLSVWSVDEPWTIGRFDIFAAMGAWDTAHRQAFVKWCSSPWTR